MILAAILVEGPIERGTQTLVTVTDARDRPMPGATVRVVHRPGLDGTKELAIGITDSLGRVRWTPEQAGVAEIRVEKEVLPVAIGWTEPPAGAVTLLALLLLAAVGGIGFGATGRRWRG